MDDYFLSMGDSLKALGARAQRLRLTRNLTQQELAMNAGVGIKALRRFESTGNGTLETVMRLAVALGVQDVVRTLFEPPRFTSLAEVEAQTPAFTRRRARKRS